MKTKNKIKNQTIEKEKNIWKSIVYMILFILFIYLCFWLNEFIKNKNNQALLNPVLNTKIGKNIETNEQINLEYFFEKYEKEKIKKGEIANLSIYFRNLNNGNWFGINEKEKFSPASLMKLPLLMAYYKKEEAEPGFLDTKIQFVESEDNLAFVQNFTPKKKLEDGKEYSFREIIENMIKYSNNQTSLFLERNISMDEFKQVFYDVGIDFPQFIDDKFDDNIRIIDYVSFFRVLYNASYLNKNNSNEILKLLTQTDFKDGLFRGVYYDGIDVAHKFGERSIFGNNGIERMQLHDCGIIYYPNHPYILCIMTRGYNRDKLKLILQDVSNIIYKEVDKVYSKS